MASSDLTAKMNVRVVNVMCIYFDIPPALHTTGIPFIHCSNIDELNHAIDTYNRHKIILVCEAKHVEQLNEHINSKLVWKVFIYGNCAQNIIQKEGVTIVDTEWQLTSLIITSVMNYIHDRKLYEEKEGNNQKAVEQKANCQQLCEALEQIIPRNDSYN